MDRRKIWIRMLPPVLAAFLVLFTPYRSATSPRWLVQVVDTQGNPVAGFRVQLEWNYFGIDLAPEVDF